MAHGVGYSFPLLVGGAWRQCIYLARECRFRHNEAIARHTIALSNARDALCDALRALEDTEYDAHAEMDAALPLRDAALNNDKDCLIGVETILPG